ncbi:hypothetical protein [Streptomyces roseochromogenus]|uniref:Uncharacterized protein n=1 Tax=Streptomyces roseochromogenus subsp. oscitans DS 12.976 TaxID=1352936 RepID=V6KUK5_STRRC|nr:hypothetical protein [Streptomyces roseochromogenus]EST35822.1 hypothetical protein M878_04315 [Streptomyces roseochromogenus subsp. oscitans DS 12.976]
MGRALRHATHGVRAHHDDPATVILREAQLLIACPDSPIAAFPVCRHEVLRERA